MNVQIDMRPDFGPTRHQGDRPTCLAFSASDAHAFARGDGEPLCVEYLYYSAAKAMLRHDPNTGITLAAAADSLRKVGQPTEAAWPYNPEGPIPTEPPPDSGPLLRCASSHRRLSWGGLEAELMAGKPVVLAVSINRGWMKSLGPEHIVPLGTAIPGAHAVLAVGIGENSHGEQHFLIRNSWGTAWGENGYAWLSTSYLNEYFKGLLSVDGPID